MDQARGDTSLSEVKRPTCRALFLIQPVLEVKNLLIFKPAGQRYNKFSITT